MTNNPISLYHSGQITASQLSAFNTLLTQLAALVDQLQSFVSPLHIIQAQASLSDDMHQELDHAANAQQINAPSNDTPTISESTQLKWHYLLTDLKTVVLPEFYVVFNDPTTLAMARRQLYDLTQAIFFTLKRYLDAALTSRAKMSSPQETDAHDYLTMNQDNYINGQGRNAKLATDLLDLSRFIAVDGVTYIEQFEPYYSKLIEIKTLESFLQSHSHASLITQLEAWQIRRFMAFSLIGPRKPSQDLYMVSNTIDHPLAKWAIREVNGEEHPSVTDPQALALTAKTDQPLIARPQQFKLATTLSTIGLALLLLGSLTSLWLIALMGVVVTFTGVKQGIPAINFYGHHQQVASWTTKTLLASIFVMIFAAPLTPIALVAFALSIGVKVINNTQRLSPPHSELALEDKGVQALGDIEVTRLSSKTHEIEAQGIKTLSFEQHAHHLGALLSKDPTERLKQLIAATNELRDNQSYLQETYPYLATRVEELIKDLSQNTIIRLDELASRFVKQNQVSDEVKALFARQHEPRIDALIKVNLKQVKDLNETILEKQMAVFSDVGGEQERQFRDAIMELKILLRWLIAQQPDELQATSHQVILDNLESSTLKDMQAVFFDNNTTRDQRQVLLDQVIMMLTHFKRQSPYALDMTSTHDDSATADTEISNLLKLSHPKDSPLSDTSQTLQQAQAQKFIDYNQAYVAELIKYWH